MDVRIRKQQTDESTEQIAQTSSVGETWEPDEYPVELSPPHVRAPIYECAERATVDSLVSNAAVQVIDESDELEVC